ncbi:hypothetical protein KKI24_08860 [bacterium]|nr:hypothetical protein [bacterium]
MAIRSFIIFLLVLVSSYGCSPTIIEIDAHKPEDRTVPKFKDRSIRKVDDPMKSFNEADTLFKSAILFTRRNSETDIIISIDKLNTVMQTCNYFINQAQIGVYGWKNHSYLPLMIVMAGNSSLYQLQNIPYREIDSFFHDPTAFKKWDQYIFILVQSLYYYSLLPEADDENPIYRKNYREKSVLIEEGFREIYLLIRYVKSEILRTEIAQIEKNPIYYCDSFRILNQIQNDSNRQWLPSLIEHKMKSLKSRLNLLKKSCP